METFMSMVAAATVGNVLSFLMIVIFLGAASIKYDNPDEVGAFASMMGFILMAGVIALASVYGFNFALIYLVATIVVALVQVFVFDVRAIERRAPMIPNDARVTRMTYRWMHYSNMHNSPHVGVDRTDLGIYILAYIGCAPFLVIRWMFNEVIKSISEWIASRIGNVLTNRLNAIFGITK